MTRIAFAIAASLVVASCSGENSQAVEAEPPREDLSDSVESEVVAAVEAWLAAYEARDAQVFAGLTHPDGVQYSINYLGDERTVRAFTNASDIADIAQPGPTYREVFWDPVVMVRADLAQFWAPYSFDIDGERSHCGINSFTLLQSDGVWQVSNASWTVEPPENCMELDEPQ